MRHFEVLIIGAGSAGSVLANRLSADGTCSVGLIEAGGLPSDPDIADPLKWPDLQGRTFDWSYKTVAQPHTAGRVHDWPRGRIVGGSSCLHAMAHVRGHPLDYEPWAAAAGNRWSFEGLRPAFEKYERHTGARPPARTGAGLLDVYRPDEELSPVARAFMRAGQALGVPEIANHNEAELIGTTGNALTIRNGRRMSAADAYLTEAVLGRKNLTLMTDGVVEKLIIDGHRSGGVQVNKARGAETIFADRIVLCAGAIDSPLLLMRSGIGPAEALRAAGIEPAMDCREMGRNLQDHLLLLGNVYHACRPVPPSRLQHSESLMYLNSRDLSAYSGQPDIVLALVVAPSAAEGLIAPAYGTAFTLLCGVTHPTSRGTIRPSGPLKSDAPFIDPEYLSTRYDRETFRRALRIARKIGHHPALDAWRAGEALPGNAVQSDADLDDFIARAASTHHHPIGTCRMGRDESAVVDPDLKLVGLDNVFVVDASVMPTLPSGPIHAAVLALAETWAGMAPN